MATYSVSDDIISSAAARDYITNADRRVLIGFRAALEMLSLPLPNYAVRKPPGPAPSRAVAAAFHADQGTRSQAKPVASDPLGEHRLAAAVTKGLSKAEKRKAASLFDQTFNG